MTLPQALNSAFPQYPESAHRKAASRMEQNMTAQHTPGPWSENEGFIVGPDFETICDPRCLPPTAENIVTMEANARLIAAAPDLLEALEAICKHATQCEMHGEPSTVDGIDWDDILKARAAIRKARK